MTLNEYIEKLTKLRDLNNAGDFVVKVPYRYDADFQGTKFLDVDSTDITDELFYLNTKDKTLYISDVDESSICNQSY